MKKVKKFVSLILAAVMVMAMSVVAFADDGTQGTTTAKGTITVENPKEGESYTAYKIFDVTYSNGKDAYAYTITSDSEWYIDVDNYTGITLDPVNGTTQYIVEKAAGFNAADFANYLKGKTTGKQGNTLKNTNGVAKAENLDFGYYFVSSTSGALCNLTTTDPTATIHDKNDVPFSKTEDKDNVELGGTVTYTITGKVPNTTGFGTYEYIIEDKMSKGLDFNDDVIVKVDGAELAKDKYEYTKNADEKGFTLKIHVMDIQNNVGKTITVTYTATVNSDGVAVISKNEAKLTYSNNPVDSTDTKTISQEQKVYNAKINIVKYDSSSDQSPESTKKLGGAKFILKNSDNKYYKYNTTKDVIEWVDKEDADVFETTIDGKASINGLKDGNYILYEIEAPKGYNPLKDPVTIPINGKDSSGIIQANNLTVGVDIGNSKGALLPSTGGIGTTIFYVLGGVLVLGAAVVLVVRRRATK